MNAERLGLKQNNKKINIFHTILNRQKSYKMNIEM